MKDLDLLNISEEELEELWIDDPGILDELVRDSELEPYELAEVFVKHPILQDRILKYTDPMELYNNVYGNQIINADPAEYEYNGEEYKKIKKEYVRALNAIKQYVNEDPYYSNSPIGDAIRDAQVEVEDWNDPYGTIKRAKRAKYEEGIKLGLDKFEIEGLPNMDTSMIALILEDHPGSLEFVKKVLEQNGKTLNVEELIDYLVDEIDDPYFDPDHGYEDVEGKKNVLKELGYDYEELKDAEREEDAFYINEYGEIIRPADEELDYKPNQETKDEHHQETIDPELEQWLNGSKSKTPLQKREEELASLEAEEKEIKAEIDKQNEQEGQDIGE